MTYVIWDYFFVFLLGGNSVTVEWLFKATIFVTLKKLTQKHLLILLGFDTTKAFLNIVTQQCRMSFVAGMVGDSC